MLHRVPGQIVLLLLCTLGRAWEYSANLFKHFKIFFREKRMEKCGKTACVRPSARPRPPACLLALTSTRLVLYGAATGGHSTKTPPRRPIFPLAFKTPARQRKKSENCTRFPPPWVLSDPFLFSLVSIYSTFPHPRKRGERRGEEKRRRGPLTRKLGFVSQPERRER